MSSYVTKTIRVSPDSCKWHYRTSNASTSDGGFFTNEDSYKIAYIWDNNEDSYARIIDYSSPKSTWGVASFHLNTLSVPQNARPWSFAIKARIIYGATLYASYYAGASIYTYSPTFSEAIKTQPTLECESGSFSTMTANVSSSWESYRLGCGNNSIHLVFRLRCASNLDTYRRFNELYTELTYRVYSFDVTTPTAVGGSAQGAGTYEDGSRCSLTAIPDADYEFVSWDNGIDANPYTFTVTGDIAITPIFRKKKKQITVVSDNTQYGQVFGSGSYEIGSSVTISATPNDGYRFSHWQDGNTNRLRSITVSSDMTYTAYFVSAAPKIHSVQISPNPADIGQGFLIAVEVT